MKRYLVSSYLFGMEIPIHKISDVKDRDLTIMQILNSVLLEGLEI